jgi:hypothetical protein
MRAALPVLLLCGCLDGSVDYAGKTCTVERGCPAGLTCDPSSLTCRAGMTGPQCGVSIPAGCTYQDQTLGPADTPPTTLDGTKRLKLSGTFGALTLNSSAASCPVLVEGDGATMTGTLTLKGDHWRVTGLSFSATQSLYGLSAQNGARDVQLSGLYFASTAVSRTLGTTDYPFDVYADGPWSEWVVSGCDFSGTKAPALFAGDQGSNLTITGNHFVTDASGPTVQIESTAGATVTRNDFSGALDTAVVQFVNGGTGVVQRNYFHDLPAPGLVAVMGATQVQSNTFVRLGSNSTAASCGDFQDNIVSHVTHAIGCATGARGYNLFDQVTDVPPAATGDVSAAPQLDDAGVPLATSPAVDHADPALPVPDGGGARADIGAFERGASASACP